MNNTNSQPIICGTDLSENAGRAAVVAAALANRLDAPLLLVHASILPALAPTEDQIRSGAQFQLDDPDRLAVEVVEGEADEVLLDLAEKRQARLLVVSSAGERASGRWVLGSVAERVAENASVPTLVVRDAAPFVAWADGGRALKVFVGVDFSASSDAALRWVADLQEIGPVELVAGYVDWPPQEGARLGVVSPMGTSGNPPEMQQLLERDLRAKINGVMGSNSAGITVRGSWARAETELVDMAMDAQADLIVVGTHQWHGLGRLRHGSVSRGLLHLAPMSVACVPTPPTMPMAGPRIRACLRILVAVDLNEAHGFAAPYGYSIVNPGGTVRLFHNIVPHTARQLLDGVEPSPHLAASEVLLRRLAPDPREAPDITTEVEITQSRGTAQAICAAAERFGADIICIGSHTRPGFNAKVLGSISLSVLQNSQRPVLIVWPPVA